MTNNKNSVQIPSSSWDHMECVTMFNLSPLVSPYFLMDSLMVGSCPKITSSPHSPAKLIPNGALPFRGQLETSGQQFR